MSLTDSEGNQTEVKLPNKPFIELLINDIIADKQKNYIKVMTVFVSSNLSNAKQLETKLAEANFDSRAQSSLVVGYIEPGGKVPSL